MPITLGPILIKSACVSTNTTLVLPQPSRTIEKIKVINNLNLIGKEKYLDFNTILKNNLSTFNKDSVTKIKAKLLNYAS